MQHINGWLGKTGWLNNHPAGSLNKRFDDEAGNLTRVLLHQFFKHVNALHVAGRTTASEFAAITVRRWSL